MKSWKAAFAMQVDFLEDPMGDEDYVVIDRGSLHRG